MDKKTKFIMLASIGFGIGVITGVMITAFSATMEYNDGNLWLCSREFIESVGNPLVAFTIQAIMSGVYGIFSVGGMMIYQIEEWGLMKCTVIHYLIIMGGYFLLAFSMRWFGPSDIVTIIYMSISMTIGFFIIWLINFLKAKKVLKELNMELKEFKAMKELEGTE